MKLKVFLLNSMQNATQPYPHILPADMTVSYIPIPSSYAVPAASSVRFQSKLTQCPVSEEHQKMTVCPDKILETEVPFSPGGRISAH